MADNPVAIAELRVMADYFVSAELPYFEELREAFKLLRHTGCRIQEIFDISRWEVSSGYTVIVQPQKGNNTRTIILNSDFDDFLAAITGQYSPFLGRTYSQLQGLFYKINPYGKLYSATKEITNYFFRYLFVRELDELGMTLQQIADEMGYTSTTAVNNYLNADLTSTIEVPVSNDLIFGGVSYPTVDIAGYRIITRDLIFSDNGAGIYINPVIPNFLDFYGLIYGWEARERIIPQLPANWRVPSIAEMTAIWNTFGGIATAANASKEHSNTFWTNLNGTNTSGCYFRGTGYHSGSAFGGYRTYNYMHLSDYKSLTLYYAQVISASGANITLTVTPSKTSLRSSMRILKSL